MRRRGGKVKVENWEGVRNFMVNYLNLTIKGIIVMAKAISHLCTFIYGFLCMFPIIK